MYLQLSGNEWLVLFFFLPNSVFALCDIYQKAHLWKVFLCRTTPPNSPVVHIKSKWKKEWPQWGKWGGGWWRDLIDRDIYMCVCEAKVEQKKVEYLCYSFECILFSFTSSISLRLLHLINFSSSGKWIFETLMHSNSWSDALNHL